MELVRRPDECPVLFQVHLHDAQAGRVPGAVVQGYPCAKVVLRFGECDPV
jgi:hypothetical protein